MRQAVRERRSVVEDPLLGALALRDRRAEGVVGLPEVEHLVLDRGKARARDDGGRRSAAGPKRTFGVGHVTPAGCDASCEDDPRAEPRYHPACSGSVAGAPSHCGCDGPAPLGSTGAGPCSSESSPVMAGSMLVPRFYPHLPVRGIGSRDRRDGPVADVPPRSRRWRGGLPPFRAPRTAPRHEIVGSKIRARETVGFSRPETAHDLDGPTSPVGEREQRPPSGRRRQRDPVRAEHDQVPGHMGGIHECMKSRGLDDRRRPRPIWATMPGTGRAPRSTMRSRGATRTAAGRTTSG